MQRRKYKQQESAKSSSALGERTREWREFTPEIHLTLFQIRDLNCGTVFASSMPRDFCTQTTHYWLFPNMRHCKGARYGKVWRIEPVAHAWRQLCLIIFLFGCGPQRPDATKILQGTQSADANKKILLGWNQKIDSTKFGMTANKNIDGKTLALVISSQSIGRDDALLCSSCHNASDAQGGYGVPAQKNAASPNLTPTDLVTNRTWVGKGGWAERFVKNNTKPANLKVFVQAWIDNGYK